MSNWPISVPGGGQGVSAAVSTTTGSAPTYGSWVELVASVPAGVVGVILHRTLQGSAHTAINLAIGAAGSEVIVAADIFVQSTSTAGHACDSMHIPLSLPEGARLAIQTTRVGSGLQQTWRVEFVCGAGLHPLGCSRVVTYGFDVSAMLGTTLTAGASGTWGTGVQVVGSTPRRARFLSITGFGAQNGVTLRGLVGAFYGTSDRQAATAFPAASQTTTDSIQCLTEPRFVPCDIPAGSDIRLRLLHETTGAPTRAFQLHLGF